MAEKTKKEPERALSEDAERAVAAAGNSNHKASKAKKADAEPAVPFTLIELPPESAVKKKHGGKTEKKAEAQQEGAPDAKTAEEVLNGLLEKGKSPANSPTKSWKCWRR